MRIALVSDTYTPQVNGVSTVLRRIVEVLRDARHGVVMVAPEYPEPKPPGTGPDELRVPSLAFPPYPAIRLSLPAPRRVAHFLDGYGPDLVHVATEGPLGMVGRAYALRRRLPLVTSYHTHFPRYMRDYGAAALEGAAWRWMRWFHGPAALTQTPGDEARRELLAHGIPRAVVWGQGVDTTHFHHAKRDMACRRRLGIADDQALVLHVGRLAAEKNLDVLIGAWTLAHEQLGGRARFCVAGEGPVAERLADRMPWAVRLGFVDRARLATLYASADLCVLPSRSETCGLVALEAMASGLPVVAARAGGLAESVRHERTGFLIEPDDVRGFAAAIADLVLQPSLRRALGAQARLAAVGRDRLAEDEERLEQYAGLVHPGAEGLWRAAS